MKRLSILLLLFISFQLVCYSQDYFPLKIGNKFLYQYSWHNYNPGGSSSGGGYCVMSVTDTTTLNGKKYFNCSGGPVSGLLRVDSVTKSLYSYNPQNSCSYYYYENLVDSLYPNYTGFENSCNNYYCDGTGIDSLFGTGSYKIHFSHSIIPDNVLASETQRDYNQKYGFEKYYLSYWYGHTYGSELYMLKGCIIDGILYGDTTGMSTGITIINNNIPVKFSLSQNYPNPFNLTTKIKFAMPKAGDAKIIVYDVMGREVQTLVNERLQAGTYETSFDGSGLNSGVYFYKLIVRHDGSSTEGFTETKRMLMIK